MIILGAMMIVGILLSAWIDPPRDRYVDKNHIDLNPFRWM